jgi:hypothetical protein
MALTRLYSDSNLSIFTLDLVTIPAFDNINGRHRISNVLSARPRTGCDNENRGRVKCLLCLIIAVDPGVRVLDGNPGFTPTERRSNDQNCISGVCVLQTYSSA